MKIRWVISLIVLGAFILISQPAIADDLADLKATHKSYMKAVNNGEVDTFMDIWLEGGLFLVPSSVFPIVVNIASVKKIYYKWYETHTRRSRPYKPDYRVIGNTGLVWGHVQAVVMNKEKGIGERRFNKFLMTWVKIQGKWKLAAHHVTRIAKEVELF